jgi:acetolactate synthase-1/3 small subunit
MTDLLALEIDWAYGTLQRIIGLIERRGFEIANLEVVDMGLMRHVEVTVRARNECRSFEILCRQVDRLYGVARIQKAASAYTNHRFPLVG